MPHPCRAPRPVFVRKCVAVVGVIYARKILCVEQGVSGARGQHGHALGRCARARPRRPPRRRPCRATRRRGRTRRRRSSRRAWRRRSFAVERRRMPRRRGSTSFAALATSMAREVQGRALPGRGAQARPRRPSLGAARCRAGSRHGWTRRPNPTPSLTPSFDRRRCRTA
jgi:hypothetical protein